jgi:ethanolamine utilization protein EutA
VQVSGKTIHLPDADVLPVHNVPVVHLAIDLAGAIDSAALADAIRSGAARMDLDLGAPMAISFTWRGDPEYGRLMAAAAGIAQALAAYRKSDTLLVLMIDGDVGRTLGHLLDHELDLPGRIVSIDGVQLQELDFVDLGALIAPPGVVPVVIKSLLFS